MKKTLPLILLVIGMILGSHEGFIALFTQNCPQPLEIYPYRTEILPTADQEALAAGIPVTDEAHLTRLLEDFLS